MQFEAGLEKSLACRYQFASPFRSDVLDNGVSSVALS